MKYVTPSVRETAFNCPHCHALAAQTWWKLSGQKINKTDRLPWIATEDENHDWSHVEDKDARKQILDLVKQALSRKPFFIIGEDEWGRPLANINLSRCFNCEALSVWIYDSLVFPRQAGGPLANPDTPSDIRADYEEASAILDASPRGAAALLRLCIQKLCVHLKQPGKNINDDIGALVASGDINSHIQKALDAVRVIGNNAVHPGKIDLKDDRATAETLFRLFNLIVEKTVSEKLMIEAVYAGLPEGALKQIEARDKPKA